MCAGALDLLEHGELRTLKQNQAWKFCESTGQGHPEPAEELIVLRLASTMFLFCHQSPVATSHCFVNMHLEQLLLSPEESRVALSFLLAGCMQAAAMAASTVHLHEVMIQNGRQSG